LGLDGQIDWLGDSPMISQTGQSQPHDERFLAKSVAGYPRVVGLFLVVLSGYSEFIAWQEALQGNRFSCFWNFFIASLMVIGAGGFLFPVYERLSWRNSPLKWTVTYVLAFFAGTANCLALSFIRWV
jgi:hypothetical protein